MEAFGTLKEHIIPADQAPEPSVGRSIRSTIAAPSERHKMVVTLHCAGWTGKAIAESMGYTEMTVSNILNDPHPELEAHRRLMQEKVADHSTDVLLRFRAESMKSVETLVEIRDTPDAPLSEKRLSALAILDRAGYSPVKKQMNVNANVPIQELNAAAERIEKANQAVAGRDQWEVKTLSPEELESSRKI